MKHLFIIFLLALCNHKISAQQNGYTNYNIPLQKIIDSLKINKAQVKIYVSKTKYTLSLMASSKVLKSYPVVLGTNPVDDKLCEGDRCTPEGSYKVKAKYPHKSWSKFIWFDYPNEEAWKRFSQTKKEGKIPKNAGIGGDVGIHGVPDEADYVISQKQNWTWGCISLKTHDINEIYNISYVGMPIEIRK